ncbi:MAG: carbohydrate ABC transporter substrate-binding protein [Deltaproteobacteria bacterium]|nr:MAG: carbohydrate ABC transporter substrate-binding protein [Deltaproteobacteria bacterium]
MAFSTKGLKEKTVGVITRREFIKTTLATGVLFGTGGLIFPRYGLAKPKTLKILQMAHFVPAFDQWFKNTYVKEWGEKNDTQVIVDHVSILELLEMPVAEVSAQKGHDLVMFIRPPPAFEDHVIDHREICQECEKKYGNAIPMATKSSYNPRTKKYYAFSDSFAPDPINYRQDLWDGVGMYPDTWEDVRIGGAKIKKKYGNPVGIGLSPEDDSSMALRAIMYSHGASVQDEEGNVVINSKQTLEAVKFVRALFKEAMTPEVFNWHPASNNTFMLQGKGSLALNAISITRAAEKEDPEMSKKIWLAKSPAGPVRRMGLAHLMNVYVIWKFAENIEGAKQFLVDYIGTFRKAFLASEFYNFPCFPGTVSDLKTIIANDPKADPPDKYKVLGDVQEWTTNVGYPGYANAAIDEIFGTYVIIKMFRKAARDEATPEDAVKEAEAECKRIFAIWKERGVV